MIPYLQDREEPMETETSSESKKEDGVKEEARDEEKIVDEKEKKEESEKEKEEKKEEKSEEDKQVGSQNWLLLSILTDCLLKNTELITVSIVPSLHTKVGRKCSI